MIQWMQELQNTLDPLKASITKKTYYVKRINKDQIRIYTDKQLKSAMNIVLSSQSTGHYFVYDNPYLSSSFENTKNYNVKINNQNDNNEELWNRFMVKAMKDNIFTIGEDSYNILDYSRYKDKIIKINELSHTNIENKLLTNNDYTTNITLKTKKTGNFKGDDCATCAENYYGENYEVLEQLRLVIIMEHVKVMVHVYVIILLN